MIYILENFKMHNTIYVAIDEWYIEMALEKDFIGCYFHILTYVALVAFTQTV